MFNRLSRQPVTENVKMDDQEEKSPQLTAMGHQREQLEKARMAEFVLSPKTEEAKAFAELLTRLTLDHEAKSQPRKRKRRANDLQGFQGAIAAFSAD